MSRQCWRPVWADVVLAAICLSYLAIINLIAVSMYSMDKFAAVSGFGEQRVPESTLHLYGLLGGWPGALVARHVLRHKTRKQPFVFVFWVTAAINVAAALAIGLTLPPQASL